MPSLSVWASVANQLLDEIREPIKHLLGFCLSLNQRVELSVGLLLTFPQFLHRTQHRSTYDDQIPDAAFDLFESFLCCHAVLRLRIRGNSQNHY